MSRLSAQGSRAVEVVLLVSGCLWLCSAGFAAELRPTAMVPVQAPAPGEDAKARAPRDVGRCVYVVRRGDSVARIAAQYRIPQHSIMTINHLANGGALRVGQRLQITGCKAAAARRVPERGTAVISRNGPELLARVGPRRIPTPLYMAVPEFRTWPVLRWPIEGPILSGFGRRAGGWHAGVDIKGEVGAPIRAAAAGIVVVSTWEATYGYIIKIQHSEGLITLYAHNLKNLVEVGDEVNPGALIATVGRSGRASAFHVHFEVRKGGTAYNPLYLLETADAPVLASAPDLPPDDGGAP